MKIYDDKSNAVSDYKDYIRRHVLNVKKAWTDLHLLLLRNQGKVSDFLENLGYGGYYRDSITNIFSIVASQILHHDESKYGMSEFIAYRKKFYPYKNDNNIEHEFDYAFNHHQKSNPHHWQYWMYVESGDNITYLDMPIADLLEMICDWRSFVYGKDGASTNKWYNENKDTIKLSDNSRKAIEFILELDPKF